MLSMSIQLMQEEIVGKIGSLLKSLGIGRAEDEEFMKVKDVVKTGVESLLFPRAKLKSEII